jgi:hypothetical protein
MGAVNMSLQKISAPKSSLTGPAFKSAGVRHLVLSQRPGKRVRLAAHFTLPTRTVSLVLQPVSGAGHHTGAPSTPLGVVHRAHVVRKHFGGPVRTTAHFT